MNRESTQHFIVILGGGINPDGILREPSQCRVECAADLFKQQAETSTQIITSSKYSFRLDFTPPTTIAAAMKQYLIELGIPSESILVEDKSMDTVGNVYFTNKLFLRKHPGSKVTVMTSSFQLKRAQYLFEKFLGDRHDISYVCAQNGLGKIDLGIQKIIEKKLMRVTKKEFDSITDGDDIALEKIILAKHPAFQTNPLKTNGSNTLITEEVSPFHRNKLKVDD